MRVRGPIAPARSGALGRAPWWLGAVGLLVACGVRMPDPVVESVDPARGWNGADTVVTIRGAAFFPQIELDAGQRGRADLDDGFDAWLQGPDGADERFDLFGVSALDTSTLRGIVGAGLVPGEYDLVVEGPTGHLGRLRQAFTASDIQADHLHLDVTTPTWEVGEYALVEVSLLDPNDERVLVDLPVAIEVVPGDPTAPPVTFGQIGGMILPVVEGGSVSGDLGPDGVATVQFTATRSGTYTVRARSLDERSAVDRGELLLLFEPSSDLTLDIRLPDAGFTAEAGLPFDVELELRDVHGNPVPDEPTAVFLRNACNTWLGAAQVTGTATVEVRIDAATGEGCAEDRIVTDEISPVQGSSDPFEVDPGPVDHFEVDVLAAPLTAGDTLWSEVVPVDAWGNEAAWSGALTLSDSVGGLAAPECTAAGICKAQTTVAGEDIVLTVQDQAGIQGVSAPYDVAPGHTIGSVEVSTPVAAEAGAATVVDVVLRDLWGNLIDAASHGAEVLVADELGEGDCAVSGYTALGAAQVTCTLYTARADAILTATADGVVGASGAFALDNGPLARVAVTAVGPVVAGELFDATFVGTDAWGNPYVSQTDPVVDLTDTSGTFSLSSVTLGPDGVAAVQASLTKAGAAVVEASQGGSLLGASAPITVLPAPADGLRVTVLAPWAWLGVPTDARVEAIDPWGNRSEASGYVTVSSRTTASPPVGVTLVNGVGTVQFTWTEAAFDDVLEVNNAGGYAGESDPLHVVLDCPDTGPTAALSFGGFPEALACFDEATGQGTIAGSFVGSSSGGAPIDTYVLAALGGPKASDALPTVLLDLPSVGVHPLAGLVVQSDLCAAEIAAAAYVGVDDDSPVGPITLLPVAAELDAGTGVTDVLVEDVVDCSRDVAVGGTVKLRVTLGELTGVTPTGSGLSVVLDANGDATVGLDVASAVTAGAATVHAWVDSGAAVGLTTVDVVQDLQLPTVWEQLPAGETLGLVDEVRLVFSEPVRAANAIPANFAVIGPAPVTVTSVTLEAGDTEAVLALDPPADGALGTWTVAGSDDVRDLAGNRLDGAWSGTRSSYAGAFGAVGTTVDAVTCGTVTPEGGVFRPDGDDGAGAEADLLEIHASTAFAPTWWVLSVTRQSTGALVRRDHLVPSGAAETLEWDGRDQAGRVVANGAYTVEIEPLDSVGNRGPGCTITATVDNRVGALP